VTNEEMQALVVEGLRQSVAGLCSTMLGCEVTAGDARVLEHPLQEAEGVIALIGMAGPWFGTGAILCKPELACKIAGAMLMSEYNSVNEDVLDAIAEVSNIVIGNLKTVIEEEVGPMGLSTPTIIHGASFTTKIGGSNGWTLIPFQMMGGELVVQACVLPNVEGRSAARIDITGHALTAS
jgi:chemotaxis protein CheX